MPAPDCRPVRREACRRAAALTWAFLVSAALLMQATAAPADPAAEFVQLSVDIEILSWGGGLGGTEGPRSRSFRIDAIVGRNKWVISNRAFGQTNQYSFDGAKLTERTWMSTGSPSPGPDGTGESGHWWTRTTEAADGNPGETVRVSDHLDMVSRIAWLAFCSGPTLNDPKHRLYPPWDFWKEFLDPSTFVEKVDRFEDDLGVPRSVLIFSGEHQPVVDYRVSTTTNVAGWLFPQSFYLLEYNPTGTKGWMLALLAHGRISSIGPAADPLPVDSAVRQARDHALRFVAVSASKLHIEGTSDVHDWALETTNVVGFLELDKPLYGPSSQEPGSPETGSLNAQAELFFPVRHFTGGAAPMFSDKADRAVLHRALRTTDNPNVVYRLHHLTTTGAPASKTSALVLQSTGELVIGGVTNVISFPIHVAPEGDALTLSGSAAVRLSDFGIEPPSAQGKGWVVKVGNTVESSFELRLKKVEPH